MDMYNKFQSPLGYQTGEGQIDTYGVDHSGFSTRDELEYQFARQNKENQLIQNYNNQGITKNYPQYGTNFWGNSDNNYGFGSSNIHDNIENRNNNPFENTVNTFGQNQTGQSYGLGSDSQNQNQTFGLENNNSTQWGLNNTPLTQNNNAYLDFNGKELRWHQNNKVTNSWKAMSGQPDYQCKEFTNVPNKGPIPEGQWIVKQSNLQNFDDLSLKDKAKSYIGSITKLFGVPAGSWPGAQASWGNSRVWLEPAQETNTHGRTDLSIHGGWNYGSAGCIDLAPNMDDFKRMFQNHGNDMKLNVKYDKNCW